MSVLSISGTESWQSRSGSDPAQDFRNARHEIIPNAGHWVHHDQLDLVTNLVTSFLD